MTGGICPKKKGKKARKHTPIVSKEQFGMMEHLTAEGKISKKVMRAHEIEARGKKLPKYAHGGKSKKRRHA